MLISSDTIKEIAEQLDCGFRAFMHKHNHEMIFIPNEDDLPGIDMEMWEEVLEKLDAHFEDYHEIEKWSSRYAFNIMAEFTALPTLSQKVKNKLIKALNHKGPFRHFKFEIDQLNSERQEWFDFKNKCQEDYVLEQIRMLHQM
jgi:hypothetical protein